MAPHSSTAAFAAGTVDSETRLIIDGSTPSLARRSGTWGSGWFAGLVVALVLALVAVPFVGWAADTPIAADSFTRNVSNGWGSAEMGGSYSVQGTAASFAVDGSAATISLPAAGSNRAALLAGTTARDVDIRARFALNKLPTAGNLFAYLVARRSGTNEYRPKLVLHSNGQASVHAGAVINGSESAIGARVIVPALTYGPGAYVWLRATVAGANPTHVRVKAWADGAAEPQEWHFTASSSAAPLQAAGYLGVRAYVDGTVSNTPVVLSVDDLTANPTGDPNATPTPTPTPLPPTPTLGMPTADPSVGPTPELTPDPTAPAPTPEPTPEPTPLPTPQSPVVFASDSFSRTATSSWRVADAGSLYSYQGRLVDYAVDGSGATLTLPSAGQTRSAFLLSTYAHDVDMTFTASTNKLAAGGSIWVYGAMRRQTDGTSYRAKLRLAPDGSVFAHGSRTTSASEMPLGTEQRVVGLTYGPGTVLNVRGSVSGTGPSTLRVRVWLAGQPEPPAWHFQATDSSSALQGPGSIGLLSHVTSGSTNAPVVVRFDDLVATTGDPIARPQGPTLVGAGDIGQCNLNTDEATAVLLDQLPGTVFVAGDNAYPNGTAADFANCYDPTWGRHRARTAPAVGNHEYNAHTDAGPYFAYFGAAAGEVGKGYYAFDLGTWRVYVLNSNCGFVPCTPGSAQEQWFRADLAANARSCTLAVWHHPRYSSGSEHGDVIAVQPFWQAAFDAGMEMVVNGHDHNYERFAPMNASGGADAAKGIREFVVGTGGTTLRTLASTFRPNSEVRQASAHGVLSLTLGNGNYEWEFIPVAGQTFTDRGSGTCH